MQQQKPQVQRVFSVFMEAVVARMSLEMIMVLLLQMTVHLDLSMQLISK